MPVQKIGISELLDLKRSARGYYLTVPRKLVDVYDLRVGDTLKVEVLEVHRREEHREESQ